MILDAEREETLDKQKLSQNQEGGLQPYGFQGQVGDT